MGGWTLLLQKTLEKNPFPSLFQLPEVPTLLDKWPHISLTSASDITSPPTVLPQSFTYKNLCDYMASTKKMCPSPDP